MPNGKSEKNIRPWNRRGSVTGEKDGKPTQSQ